MASKKKDFTLTRESGTVTDKRTGGPRKKPPSNFHLPLKHFTKKEK